MSKRFTKIICAMTASTFILGAVAAAGCSNYYNSTALPGDIKADAEAVSNGGFAVEKGDYIYYINGVEVGTALNDFGKPVKGAIYRVSKDNLDKRNYSTVQKVVPSIVYSTDYNAGIFIYGDRIYYGTPSTAKTSEGVVQNSYLDMKSSKLDGTETLKEAYVSFPSAAYEYRFVEEDGVVYLLYVATSETLYDETTGVTNLHSYNTSTGVDTLLAYNVGTVTFDSEDKTNPQVYYTMSVYDYTGTSNTAYGYNQLYTVKASATEDKFAGKLKADTVKGWNDNEDEGTVDRYVNCGDLVLDGIGRPELQQNGNAKTPFNFEPDNLNSVNDLGYTYTVRSYSGGNLYYTRTTSLNSNAYLFSFEDDADLKPIANNPADGDAILSDGTAAGSYKFVEVDGEPAVLYAESTGISINYFVDGKLGNTLSDVPATDGSENTYYPIVKDGSATILSVEGDYLYYSVSGGNGYTINRVDYTGTLKDYWYANLQDESADDFVQDYKAVKILDLDASSSWYTPEFFGDYILFASTTSNMTNYNYIMVFDLDGMDNGGIRALNEQYEGIEKIITEVYGDTDKYPTKNYANLQAALRYAFYNGDYDYLKEFAAELNDALEDDADLVYSEQTFAEYDKFLTPTDDNEWKDYQGKRTVNGKEVYANNHDYYYGVLGEMSEEDIEAYAEGLKVSYLAAKPEEEPEPTWYEGLSTVAKVFFVIGMCVLGAGVIVGGAFLTVYLVRRGRKQPEERRRRIKVDTTDDRSVDVYDYNE
ncbi:MAG: hypothetical protein K2O89_05210 [Clostridia bacterium]|nr:hypothetical protein [Clostridia bacterium]